MRERPENHGKIIDGIFFNSEAVFCDICGWRDQMLIIGIIHDNRTYDFCKRHSPQVIRSFIENKMSPFSISKSSGSTGSESKNSGEQSTLKFNNF